jgi:hypothetical protein
LTAVQENAARRAGSDQANLSQAILSFARAADTTSVAAASAASSAPPSNSRVWLDEPRPSVDARAAFAAVSSGPVDAVARFAAPIPIELHVASVMSDESAKDAGGAETAVPPPEPLLAGVLRVDLSAIEAGVERFFARLETLGDEWSDTDVAWRLGALSMLAAGAAATLEFARGQVNERPSEPLPFGGWRLPPPPRPKEKAT